ncbi:MAG TPA: hypothetical protein VKX25_08730 [Bryobacteraceae bacterium]|nr:hypothetical protein [Bryobacteraceae bacterium]
MFTRAMDEQLVGTLRHENYTAEIFSISLPGEFRVVYRDPQGQAIEEAMLTGISSYKQREAEIHRRLEKLAHGAAPSETTDRGDSGEY